WERRETGTRKVQRSLWQKAARKPRRGVPGQGRPRRHTRRSSPDSSRDAENKRSYRRFHRASGYRSNEKPGNRIEKEGNPKEDQGQGGKDAGMHRAGGFGELVGDHRRQRVAGGKQRGVDLRRVADHHRHRHRLAQGPAQAQQPGPQHSSPAVGKDGQADRLPARRAERQGGFAQGARHGAQYLDANRGDGRQNHHREDQPSGKIAKPQRRPPEQRQKSQGARQGRLEELAKPRHHHEQSPQAVDHAGDRRQELQRERHDRP